MRDANISLKDSPINIEIHDIFRDLIHITVTNKNESYQRNPQFQRLDTFTSSQVRSILQLIPAFAASDAPVSAFQLLFPEGIASVLNLLKADILPMLSGFNKQNHNLNSLPITIENIASTFGLLSTLSVITNQYYLHQISQQISDIQAKLDQVLDFLHTDKACEIYGETMAVLGISHNFASIMACPEQRTASIQTIQHAKIVAERNIQFYYREMNKLSEKANETKRIKEDLQNYAQVVNLYGLCSTLEIVISQNYDPLYLDYVEADLDAHVKAHIGSVNNLKGKLEVKLKPAPTFPFVAPPKPDPNVESLVSEVSEILGKKSPVIGFEDTIKQIRSTFNTKAEYIIESNGAVYQRKV